MIQRRAFSLAVLAGFACPTIASAQDWPSKTITAIVPLGAGSASDIIARVVMEQVGRQLGQTVVVENRPGAGGTIGANMVAKAAPTRSIPSFLMIRSMTSSR
jgi:tripartite-type tricarboxylate transporter receptor subunit TctC